MTMLRLTREGRRMARRQAAERLDMASFEAARRAMARAVERAELAAA